MKSILQYTSEAVKGKNNINNAASALPNLLGRRTSQAVKNNPFTFKSLPIAVTEEEITTPLLNSLANRLYFRGKKNFNKYFDLLKNNFDGQPCILTGRVKEPSSIVPKLSKRKHYLTDNNNTLIQNGFRAVPDLTGYKVVLNTGSEKEVEAVFNKIVKMLENKELEPSHFFNYGIKPYFTPEQCAKLEQLGMYYNKCKKPSGFTCINSYFNTKSGETIELQIIAKESNKVNLNEHKFYNFNTKGAATEHGKTDRVLQKLFETMNDEQKALYRNYTNDCYAYARELEKGAKAEKPKLPDGFNIILELL